MDYNEFIRLTAANLPVPTLNIRPGRTEGFAKVDPKVHSYSEEPPVRQHLGQEYVYRYMLKQEEEAEEPPDNSLDDVEGLTSVAGTLPNPDEVFQDQLTQVYEIYSFDRKTVSDLLVHKHKQEILEFIESNSIVVIKGHTGCGKTTQVPQFILDNAAAANIHCNIVVTQPRRIATKSVAERVAYERGWGLGTIVGYQIALERKASKDTRLLYCTTGVLLQQLILAQSLGQYTHIIVDEVHERDQETDFLLILLKIFLRRSNCRTKIILMSATLHADKFVDYFSKKVKGGITIEPPVIPLQCGINHPVKIYYLEDLQAGKIPIVIPDTFIDSPSIDKHMYNLACSLVEVFHSIDKHEHNDDFKGSVLIFLPGLHEIEVLFEALKKREEEREDQSESWWLCPIHSTVTSAEQAKVFLDPPPKHRKIILATNICESSITVTDVKYVIDFCLMKYQVQEVDTSYTSLQLGWMSKSQGQQRAGRVGRVMPGRVYRLVKQTVYEMFEEDSCPEILRCSLDQLVLKAKRLAPQSPPAEILANALDPPDLSNILRTIANLKELGALTVTSGGRYIEDNGDLTFIGHVMASLPLDVQLSKLIIIGHMFGLLSESITMACAMAVRNIFSTPFRQQLDAYNSKIVWSDYTCSDPIAFLIAYQVWRHKTQAGYFDRFSGTKKEEDLARRYFIQPKAMGEVARLEREVTLRLKNLNIDCQNNIKWSDGERSLILKVILAGAFFPNYFVRCQPDEKEAVKVLGGRNPFTSVFLTNMPMDQPGPLYASSIRKHFKHCGAEYKISFDGSSKVYIEFESSSESDINDQKKVMPGRIPIAVYRAIKLRHLQKNIPIPILPAHKARERAKILLGDIDAPLHFRGPQKQEKNYHRSYIPGANIEILNVIITHVETPSKFWVQINDDNLLRKINWIYSKLNINKGEALVKMNESPKLGSLVAAPYSENKSPKIDYYRARVRSFGLSNNVQVFFIDYGNTTWVHKNDIREFGPGLLEAGIKEEPEMALECSLTEIQAGNLFLASCNGNWSEMAIKQFKSYCEQPACAKIYSVVNDVLSVILFRNIDIEQSDTTDRLSFEKSVNALLIKKNFAERCDEPYLSRENHMLRETIRKRPDQVPSFSITSSATSTHGDVESPSDFECNHKALLKGPNNPLEIKLFCLSRKCMGKEVNVEWNSVNSVLLDTDPMDPHERLLVAASVTQNPTGERLTLRNTTMLPNIHGLLATIAMIFSPRSELRPNITRTRLNGVLCGLGFDPDTKQSYNPENDMEINFDTVFTLEDLEQINKLRFYMNQVVYGGTEWEKEMNSTSVDAAQKKVNTHIKKILLKKRPSQGVQSSTSFRWGEIDEAEMLRPSSSEIETPSIYPLIWGIELTEEQMTVQKENCLKKLHYIAEGKEIMKTSIKCLLCEVLLDDVGSIKHHLTTSLHRELLSSFQSTSN